MIGRRDPRVRVSALSTGDPVRVAEFRTDVRYAQLWHDGWRNVDRVARYYGRCTECNSPCYAFDDGENDPRGVLGDNALWVIVADDDEEVELTACAVCANQEPAYRSVLAVWHHYQRAMAQRH